jgi:hypothetical protein
LQTSADKAKKKRALLIPPMNASLWWSARRKPLPKDSDCAPTVNAGQENNQEN